MLVAASVASAASADAAAPPATVATAGGAQARGGWMPFAQQGGSTGVNFASQGADTALHFFTDPKCAAPARSPRTRGHALALAPTRAPAPPAAARVH